MSLSTLRDELLARRAPAGHWVGRLSSSGLANATAIGAFATTGSPEDRPRIDAGLAWLAANQNLDGGFGDTPESKSNISTAMLCRAALRLADAERRYPDLLARLEHYLDANAGRTPAGRAEAIRRRYGRDRTFSVPILTMSAVAGLVPWREVPHLPFELACLPQSWYRLARLPVVSYALPALIAIGQAVRHHRSGRLSPIRLTGRLARGRTLKILRAIQPTSGGYLEATPLTAFVVMSLAACGQGSSPVVAEGLRFLRESMRPDGSWPIDTDLSVWVTTLAVNALGDEAKGLPDADLLLQWLLDQQLQVRHPYTGSPPGGWGWSDKSGSVPDGDDTPGAILALTKLAPLEQTREARRRALQWLFGLQNGDGGWPTFCRGWGKLPFDRSGSDLTAHVLRAIAASPDLEDRRSGRATERGFAYLAKNQAADGSWLPLWFGHQEARDEANPVYGTARVLMAYRDAGRADAPECRRGVEYLLAQQGDDGGFGGERGTPPCVEQTAVALDALVDLAGRESSAVRRAGDWLSGAVGRGEHRRATPIGFYFAKLWYDEEMYPLTFALSALRRLSGEEGGVRLHPNGGPATIARDAGTSHAFQGRRS